MKPLWLLVLMLCLTVTVGSATESGRKEPGQIVVRGNRIPATKLTVANGRLMAGETTILWASKPVNRAPRAMTQQQTNMMTARANVASVVDSLCALGVTPTATVIADRYRSQVAVVDSVSIDTDTKVVWVYWKAGFKEEVQVGCRQPAESIDAEVELRRVLESWEPVLANGGRIYVCPNFNQIVPAYFVDSFEKALAGNVGREWREKKYQRVIKIIRADLAHPRPLQTNDGR